jgi:hypothetical protein
LHLFLHGFESLSGNTRLRAGYLMTDNLTAMSEITSIILRNKFNEMRQTALIDENTKNPRIITLTAHA